MPKIDHTQPSYGLRPEAAKFPMMCVLSFVYVCNSRCPSCPYTNSAIRQSYQDRPFMAEETFKIIADQCGQHRAWIRLSGGGEPMLHPQAVELIEYAKAKGTKIGLITNGSAFSEAAIERLLSCGTDMIEFSVDAAEAKTYRRLRPGLDWERLLATIKAFIQRRNALAAPTKIIASAINQAGVDLEKVAEFWQPLVDEFQKRKYLTWGINPDRSADPEPYLPPEERIPCPFLFERLNIDSRGQVMVCGFDIKAVTNMGNVHQKPIAEIWLGRGFEYFRQKHLSRRGDEIPLCRHCPDWKYRSWQHNYWKIVSLAEQKRQNRLAPK